MVVSTHGSIQRRMRICNLNTELGANEQVKKCSHCVVKSEVDEFWEILIG